MEPASDGDIAIDSRLGAGDERTLADDVLDGLTRPFKELPPKHFYDARGAELFDRICELPEYYPTRTERAILEARAAEIVDAHRRGRAGRAGLGHGRQDACCCSTRCATPARCDRYVPFDVSEAMVLRDAPTSSSRSTRACACTAMVGDFERHLRHAARRRPRARA